WDTSLHTVWRKRPDGHDTMATPWDPGAPSKDLSRHSMEPRPQRPRQPQGGQQPRQPGQGQGGTPPPQHPQQGGAPDFDTQAYPQGYDPSAFVAPPRTDYDYSPLDLAPPGQRRRRQIIAGVIGALAVILI